MNRWHKVVVVTVEMSDEVAGVADTVAAVWDPHIGHMQHQVVVHNNFAVVIVAAERIDRSTQSIRLEQADYSLLQADEADRMPRHPSYQAQIDPADIAEQPVLGQN